MNNHKLNSKELKALIKLIDDKDKEIFNLVYHKIIEQGYGALPTLNQSLLDTKDIVAKERIAEIIEKLKYDNLLSEITDWKLHNSEDLLKGCIIIAKYQYPEIDEADIIAQMEDINRNVENELRGTESSGAEMIKALNKVIVSDFNFTGNKRNYSGINNSFINKVIEYKIGNPIMLCVIYLLIAKQNNIPLVGINSPGHFVLAYINPQININLASKKEMMENLLFFLSPFYQGTIFQPSEYYNMWEFVKVEGLNKNELPANNIDIIKRILNNVIFAIDQRGDKDQAIQLLEIVEKI